MELTLAEVVAQAECFILPPLQLHRKPIQLRLVLEVLAVPLVEHQQRVKTPLSTALVLSEVVGGGTMKLRVPLEALVGAQL